MLSLFITSTSTVEKEKSPLLFAGRIINGDLPALPPLEKYRKKFNAISAHELFDLKVTVEVKWDFLISIQVKPSSSEFELCENCVKIIKNIAFEF